MYLQFHSFPDIVVLAGEVVNMTPPGAVWLPKPGHEGLTLIY